MQELLQAALAWVAIPWTGLLGLSFVYWLMLFIGLVDFDTSVGQCRCDEQQPHETSSKPERIAFHLI